MKVIRQFGLVAVLISLACMTLMIASCGKSDDSVTPAAVYTVTYNGNSNTGGSAPSDSNFYQQGQLVTVLGNTGSLVRTSHSFAGWNTQASGSGTTYTQAQTFTMGAANVTLYAMWTANSLYKVEYVPGTGMSAPTEGKTKFQLALTKTSDGTPATGLTPTLSFLMTMTDGTQHATPIDLVSESTTTPGTYDCTVYYLMASKMNGTSMGTWEMTVTVNNETTTFTPDVAMSMKGDTVKATLKGQLDIISSATGTEKRSYYIFNDGLTSGMTMGSGSLNLFLATKESTTSFPALVSKAISTTTLHDESGTAWIADPVTVEGSLNGTMWTTGTNTKGGHWSISLMSGITSSVTNTIYVRLNVGKDSSTPEQKTTDGKAVSSSNAYQTILVTPGTM